MVTSTLVPLLVPLAFGDFGGVRRIMVGLIALGVLYVALKVFGEAARNGNVAAVIGLVILVLVAIMLAYVGIVGQPAINILGKALWGLAGVDFEAK